MNGGRPVPSAPGGYLAGFCLRSERHGALEVVAPPVHANDRPAVRKGAVLEIERRTRALQQRLRNEEAEPEAARLTVDALALLSAAGDVRLADSVHDLRSKARAIVGDGDGDVLSAPGGRDVDPLAGKVDGVLQQVSQAVEDCGIAAADRLIDVARGQGDVDRHAEVAMGRNHFLDQ